MRTPRRPARHGRRAFGLGMARRNSHGTRSTRSASSASAARVCGSGSRSLKPSDRPTPCRLTGYAARARSRACWDAPPSTKKFSLCTSTKPSAGVRSNSAR